MTAQMKHCRHYVSVNMVSTTVINPVRDPLSCLERQTVIIMRQDDEHSYNIC